VTDISLNTNGSLTLYHRGKKVMTGTLAEITAHLQGPEAPKTRPKRQRPKSRSARWTDAAGAALSALEELQSIQQEFSEWRDNLPENLQSSALGDKLDTVCDLDIDSALETVQDAESADLPMGFGRD
jgi:hypothetical protein